MHSKILVVILFSTLLLEGFSVFNVIENCRAAGTTFYVGGTGPGNYSSIQDAMNAANPDDTIYVYSGTYNENLIIIKTLTLTGEGSGSTTIQGNGDHTVKITADAVLISGFTIKNTGGSHFCVYLTSITNCRVTNNIIKNGGDGIYLGSSNSNTIEDNTVEYNNVGIYLSSSNSNTIKSNTIKNNNANGVFSSSSSNSNIIYLNDFSDNTLSNARDQGSNSWSYNSQGNYWDDYNYYDSNGDGIGDNPYSIPGGSNQDIYPLGYFLNQDPVAYIDSVSPNPVTEGQTVTFNGRGTDDGTIIGWEWRSDRDGILSYSEDFSSSSLSVGTHIISFRVKDDDEQWSSYAQTTLIINPPNQKPNAYITNIQPNPAIEGETISFTGQGSDNDGYITEYQWRENDTTLSTSSSFTKSDFTVGTHTVIFKVKDNHNEWSTEVSADVVVLSGSTSPNQPPVANTGGPYTGEINVSLAFNGSNSYDTDGTIISYSWDFGDGNTGTGEYVEHTYTSAGNYTVNLTVTDNRSNTSTVSTYVLIQSAGSNNGNSGGQDGGASDGTSTGLFDGIPISIIAPILGIVVFLSLIGMFFYWMKHS